MNWLQRLDYCYGICDIGDSHFGNAITHGRNAKVAIEWFLSLMDAL